jgi:hypothetical protein
MRAGTGLRAAASTDFWIGTI